MRVREGLKKWGSKAGYVDVAYGAYCTGKDFCNGKIMGALIEGASCGISVAVGYGLGAIGGNLMYYDIISIILLGGLVYIGNLSGAKVDNVRPCVKKGNNLK